MNEIFKRVSVRNFREDKVTDEQVEKILRAGMQAPSAGNQQPWEFVVIKDRKNLDILSETSTYAKPIKNAPLAIVVLGNKDFMRFEDYYIQDLSACTQNMLLEATSLGLGSVWITIFPKQEAAHVLTSLLELPDNVFPYTILPIGYPVNCREPQVRYREERVHFEKYIKENHDKKKPD